eukprot:TRINITY_DN19525_c0_g1_i3.p4 TRINITY_DN19525_c0_g1~~TRINITY_DN19525_c0_g1_i3.p4  ORF type:complete len:116 (-),score=6.95 TRINITY_DN19525_c0_g1_i3:492-839(-)
MMDLLKDCIQKKLTHYINFSRSRPSYDFLERFMRQNQDVDLDANCLCILLMSWAEENNDDISQINELKQYIDFDMLTGENVFSLYDRFFSVFDLVMPPSRVMKLTKEVLKYRRGF